MSNNSNSSGVFSKIIVIIVVIVFIVLGIIYVVFSVRNYNKFLANNPIIISGKDDRTIISSKTLPIPLNGNNFSISTWIYINDYTYNYGELKNILFVSSNINNSIGKNPTEMSPGILLDKEMNNLIIKNSTMSKKGGKPELKDDNDIVIKYIPLRKWVNIIYVLNNNVIDIYINGKLEQSKTIDGLIYTKNNSKMFIRKTKNKKNNLNTFSGSIGQLQYFTEVLKPSDILRIYNNGLSNDNVYLNDMNSKLNRAGIDIDDIKANICDSESLKLFKK